MDVRLAGIAVVTALALSACSSGSTTPSKSALPTASTSAEASTADSSAKGSGATPSTSAGSTTATANDMPMTSDGGSASTSNGGSGTKPTAGQTAGSTFSHTDAPDAPTGATGSAKPTGNNDAPVVHGYSFPDGLLGVSPYGTRSYTRVNGTLTVPTTPGRHPLVVLVHGSYPGCIWKGRDRLITAAVNTVQFPLGCGTERNDDGYGPTKGPDYVRFAASFAYLSKSLAQRGMAVLAMDVNSKEMPWIGEAHPYDMQSQLLKLHLKIASDLDRGVGFGLPWAASVKGKIDTSRIGLVGHSSGGGFALQREAAGWAGLKGVVAIEHALQSDLEIKAAPVPTLVLGGQCDEQIPADEHRNGISQLSAVAPKNPIVYAQLANATHIGALTGGGESKGALSVRPQTPACGAGRLAAPADIQGQIAQTVGDFLVPVFAGKSQFTFGTLPKPRLTAERASGTATVRVTTQTQLPGVVAPQSVRFDTSTVRVLDPLPAGQKLMLDDGL